LAKSRNVGLLHIIDDVEPNPYDSVLDDAYMQNFMDAVAGGKPLIEGLSRYTGSTMHVSSPLRFQVDQFDYSSAKISWLVTSGASGFKLYQDGVLILSLMPWVTVVTVGGLEPDTVTGNSPWVWTWRAEVPFVQSGYDYTWTVPIGTSTVDPSKFMLQVQGYGPMANVYNTCPPLNDVRTAGGRPEYCL
jgi:hypothetical protein